MVKVKEAATMTTEKIIFIGSILNSILFTPIVPAMDFFIFPSQGQSQDRQGRDDFDFFRLTRNQMGFDPMQTPNATAPPVVRIPLHSDHFSACEMTLDD